MKPSQVRFNRDNKPVLPKRLAEIVDLMYAAEQERYKVQHAADRLKDIESACRETLIERVDLKESKGVVGLTAKAEIDVKRVPEVMDWTKLHRYIRRTGSFEFLQKRLSPKAVEERWEDKKTVPGVGAINVKTVSLTKLKRRG